MNQISMPKELTIDDRWWFFEKEREIERNLALKVLLGNDSAKLYQPLGGFYQFFDPVIAGGGVDDHYLVLYKRYSFDCYSGVVLSVFSKEKELVDDIFIAGDSLEYKQKEFYSTGDGQFFIIEYIIDYDNPLGNQRYQGIRIERFYELDSTGMITLTATNRDMNICLREPIGGNIYRFQLCDSTNQL